MPRHKMEGSTQLKFRVDESLKAQLEEAAAARGNSLNVEITERLIRSIRTEPGFLEISG